MGLYLLNIIKMILQTRDETKPSSQQQADQSCLYLPKRLERWTQPSVESGNHKLTMELDLRSLFGLLCTAVLIC